MKFSDLLMGNINFLGYENFNSDLKAMKDVEILGKQHGLIIISHPGGYYSKEHGKHVTCVRIKDLENYEPTQ